MNGQMYQLCCIAAAAKTALKSSSALIYTPVKYENKIEFQFLPEKKLFITKAYRAENVTAWFNRCVKKGLQDIMLLTPISVDDRAVLGFSNTTQSSLVCFYREKVSYFQAQWEFDTEQKMWNVLYTELEWKDAPIKRPHFKNNCEGFRTALVNIKDLAVRIECNGFAEIFQKALDLLAGSPDYPDAAYNLPLPKIPEDNMKYFEAASIADVFGAMGSWNDSPPYMAHEKGLNQEYEALSDELLKQVRLATLYAVNEW